MPKGKQAKPYAFGNPGGGRTTGSKNRLSKAFIDALCTDFDRHGALAIERCRLEDPAAYLRTIAYVVPRELSVRHGFEDYSEEQLERAAERLRALIDAGGPRLDRTRLGPAPGEKEVIDVPAVQ